MRSLYVRLFVAFVVVLLLSVAVLYQAWMTVTRPGIARMVGGSQAALADEAAAAMQRRSGECA